MPLTDYQVASRDARSGRMPADLATRRDIVDLWREILAYEARLGHPMARAELEAFIAGWDIQT